MPKLDKATKGRIYHDLTSYKKKCKNYNFLKEKLDQAYFQNMRNASRQKSNFKLDDGQVDFSRCPFEVLHIFVSFIYYLLISILIILFLGYV